MLLIKPVLSPLTQILKQSRKAENLCLGHSYFLSIVDVAPESGLVIQFSAVVPRVIHVAILPKGLLYLRSARVKTI
jgi:hypothetical protein